MTRAPQTIEVIDPRWLLKAGGLTLLVALLCGYITLCALFYQGQWQFAVQPSPHIEQNPATLDLPFESVRFGVDATGTPQLTGWFIPSDTPGTATVLVLHRGLSNMSDALPNAKLLHTARLNVLLFDYRGFGASAGPHPTETMMEADSRSALTYLTDTRHIPLNQIIPFGSGVGASLATQLCVQHPELPALILDGPIGDTADSVAHDPRTKLIPTSLLLHERFPIAAALSTLKTPKLIFRYRHGFPQIDPRTAADPKMTVEFELKDDIAYVQDLNRFLDLYAPHQQPAFLLPAPTKN